MHIISFVMVCGSLSLTRGQSFVECFCPVSWHFVNLDRKNWTVVMSLCHLSFLSPFPSALSLWACFCWRPLSDLKGRFLLLNIVKVVKRNDCLGLSNYNIVRCLSRFKVPSDDCCWCLIIFKTHLNVIQGSVCFYK